MRKYVSAFFFALALVGLIPQPSQAVGTAILTDSQIASIQANCLEVKSNLRILHVNDAVLRVNLGQRYQNIARRLMAPLNSRIALNGLDGVALAQTTVRYNQGINDFSKTYAQYEESLQDAIDIDCRTKPVEFYSAVSVARVNRTKVASDVSEMYKLGTAYRIQLDQFAASLAEERQ